MKKRFVFLILTLALCLFIGTATAQTTYPAKETKTTLMTSTSTSTWTAPAGTWKVTKVECWGGGGGGGKTTSRSKLGCAGGGGGAYAAYSSEIATTPGTSFNIQVGAGGASGAAGGNSYFSVSDESNAYAAAGGGKSPSNNAETPGAAGGTVSKGTGYAGGAGGRGNHDTGVLSANAGSGGGGGAAGPNGVGDKGSDGTTSTGGDGGAGKAGIGAGGDGGDGVSYGNNGKNGETYGGGGSGAAGSSFSTHDGGSGAQGAIRITYETLTLQVTRNLNYDGAPSENFTILYYDKYKEADLSTPTRDGYFFLGWTTDQAGQKYLTTDSICTKTDNYTIYAQWLYLGSISGTTSITSCANFGIENQIQASATNGVPFTYKWYLYKSGVTDPIASYGATPAIPTLASGVFAQYTANPGNYSVKRVVKIGNDEPKSAGEYTVGVTYNAGSIEAVDTTIAPGTPITITGSEVDNSVYFWTHNGNRIDATEQNLTITANALCSGTHIYKRFAKVNGCPMDSIASENTYTVEVAEVNPGKIEVKTIYTCHNGAWKVKNVTKASITPAGTIEYQWSYTDESGTEQFITNNKDSIDNSDFDISELNGKYILKRYVKVACSDWKVSEDSAIIHVAGLPGIYEAPTANYDQFCVGGQVVVDPSDDWKLESLSGGYAFPTEYRWMVSMNDGSAQLASQNDTLNQVLWAAGTYAIRAELIYFNQEECKVATKQVSVKAVSDPTLGKPSLSKEETCPNSTVELTAGSITGGIGSGPGATYTYTWEFMGGTQTEWDTISANEATYDTYHNNIINASNFFVTGDLKYRTFVSNDRGCDAYSSDTVLHVIEVPVPIVRGDTTVCPKAGEYIAFKATTTDTSYSLYWYANETTMDYVTATPTVSMTNELDTTMYVAQLDTSNGCVSARVPDAIYITYSAHLQYVDGFGNLEQTICQNEDIEGIQFRHSGDCEPTITFNPYWPEGVTRDNSDQGQTAITGKPTEAGTFNYHVALLPNEQTKCAAPNSYDGTITVNPVYNVTDVQSLCAGASYTVSDSKGHSETFTTSDVYEINLQSVNGCDSIVTLDLYVQEWNQFGYEENETLIAGWTSFSNVSSPIAADVAGSMPNSTISYDGWNGSNRSDDNLTSTSSLIPTSGNSLGLRSGTKEAFQSAVLNNGKSITIKTSTKDYGNIRLKLDFGVPRIDASSHGFVQYQFAYSTDNNTYANLGQAKYVDLEGGIIELRDNVAYGSFEFNLSNDFSQAVDNQDELYIKITFDGAAIYSALGITYSMLDNICISGKKAVNEIKITAEDNVVCTNQGITLAATAPFENTTVEPSVTTPVNYNWERIVDGESTPLEGHDYIITDDGNIPAGDYQYVVSVGEGDCILSDTLDVVGISPAYRFDIVRHGYVCSNEVDQMANIIFTDECEYVPGMFIISPSVEELRQVGVHECRLSIPTETNPCDSVITLMLDVRKAFDTTVVAYLCLGESYTDFGFNFTPTEEGVKYLISPEDWKCSTGCDSIYRVTVITSSVQEILSSESNVILAAWDMNSGVNNFKPTCGVRTSDAKFSVHNTSDFTNVSGHAPTADYCYVAGENNGALQWANLSSACSNPAKYFYYDSVYFEIKLNPENYNNLRLKFDYKRENNNGGSAFNKVNYAYKFAAGDAYTPMGSNAISGTDWSVAEFDLSSIASLDNEALYLQLEFIGGTPGNTESCGFLRGSRYIPSYITVDNLMIWADRPALTTLDGSAQTCSATYVCEGSEVVFTCQGDDDYLKFYLLNENTSEETPFAGEKEMSITPDTTATYTIKAVDQITYCDSTWTFDVEVIKQPTITYVRGSLDYGICGDVQIDNEILIENAASYSFTWLTEGNVKPAGVIFNDNGEGTITIGGTLTDVPSVRYAVEALSDARCPAAPLQKTGVVTVRKQPKWNMTLGADTVCQGTPMQFQIDTAGLNFVLVPEESRVIWSTVDGPIASTTDTSIYTLDYVADEATHSKMHYLTVNQNGCTTIDSVNIVVYDFSSDNLSCTDATYIMNYGDYFLHADSLIAPSLIHNDEEFPSKFIDTVLYRRNESEAWHQPTDSVFVPSVDNLNTTIYWKVADICGNLHECTQNITLLLPPCGDDHTVTDIDGNVYGTVRIGFNCWMNENLKTTRYADGTDVPDFRAYQGNEFYPDSAENAQIFGLLYSWSSAVGSINESGDEMVQGVCPNGWVVPNAAQYEKMLGIDVKALRAPEYWMLHDGTNTTGFTMLPAGCYNSILDRCENLLGNTYFWSSDLFTDGQVRTFEADCYCYKWQEVRNPKTAGLSVRCIQKKHTPTVVVTTNSANTITKNGATLYGNVTSLGTYDQVNAGFKYGTSESTLTSIVVKDAAMTATGLFSCDIDGLNDNTKYYFKAFAANGTDTVYGEVKDFTTTGSSPFTCGTDKVKDVQENEYPTVQIGKQCWMAQNLRTKTSVYGNVWTNPDVDSTIYGRYYDWAAVMQNESGDKVRGICPEGWHVPSDAEWTQLTAYVRLQPEYVCEGCSGIDDDWSTYCIAKALSQPTGWSDTGTGCNAGNTGDKANLTGFSAVPAGLCSTGDFSNFGDAAYFWSATRIGSGNSAWFRNLTSDGSHVYRSNGYQGIGLSVRCLRDPMTVTTDSANTVTSNSAKLYGNVTDMGGKDNVYAGFKYGTSESALTSIASDESAMYATGRFSYTITGLTANTQYYFKAFAANGTDTVYGEVKNFRTLSNNPCPNTPTVTDIENNVYNTVQIGNQCWMAENLRTNVGGGVYPKKDSQTVTGEDTVTYGRLYTWTAMMNGAGSTNYPASGSKVQGICPAGWHVPSDAEWDTLTHYVYNSANPDYKCSGCESSVWEQSTKCIANALSDTTGWRSSNSDGCDAGNTGDKANATGFSAVPAGRCSGGHFYDFGYYANFWSATQYDGDNAWYRFLFCYYSNVNSYNANKDLVFSVRCLWDKEVPAAMSVTTDSANTVTNNTATLHGTVTNMGGKDNVYAGFKYGTSESTLTSIASDESAMYDTGRFSYTITGLTANTQYYFKAFAANGTDTVYGEVKNFTTVAASTDGQPCPGAPTVSDGTNTYNTVKIGNQCWMKENLRTKIGGDGDKGYPTGAGADTVTYGRLYTWTAMMNGAGSTNYPASGSKVQGICPAGWHVPSDAEWDTLTYYVYNK